MSDVEKSPEGEYDSEAKRGYNPELISAPPEELEDFICSICHCVFCDAVQTDNGNDLADQEPCGHLFCKVCITRWLTDRHSCPLCNTPLTPDQIRPDANVRRKVRNLTVKCHIDSKQCSATGILGKSGNWWREHSKICPYKVINCPLCEEYTTQRKNMPHHTQNECLQALVWCRFRCEKLLRRWELKEHEKVCSRRPVECHQCHQEGFYLTNLDEHIESECPETVVPCTFSSVGCTMTFPRKAHEILARHIRDDVATHMTLMMREINVLRSMLAERNGDKDLASIEDKDAKFGKKRMDSKSYSKTYQVYWSLPWQTPKKDVYSGTLIKAFAEDWGISYGDTEADEEDVPVYLELRTTPKDDITIAMTISVLHPSTGVKIASKRCRHQFTKKTCWGFRSVATLSKLEREEAFGRSCGLTHLLLQIEFCRAEPPA